MCDMDDIQLTRTFYLWSIKTRERISNGKIVIYFAICERKQNSKKMEKNWRNDGIGATRAYRCIDLKSTVDKWQVTIMGQWQQKNITIFSLQWCNFSFFLSLPPPFSHIKCVYRGKLKKNELMFKATMNLKRIHLNLIA